MTYKVDGGGGIDAAARARAAEAARKAAEEAARKAAEEAARKAAEEAARKAAEEAARKAAEEAARKAAAREQEKEAIGTKAAGRYAAYGAPEEAAAPQAKPETKPAAKTEGVEAKAEAPKAEAPKADDGPMSAIDNILNKVKSFLNIGGPEASAPKPEPAKPEAPKAEAAKPETDAAAGKSLEPPALPESIKAEMELAKEQAMSKQADRKERMAKPSEAERMERAKEPIAADQEAMFNTLEPAQQQAFRELTPKSREDFNKVYEAVGGMWAEQHDFSQVASHGMRKMLQEGRLEVKDTTGQTLVGNLAERVGQELQPSMQTHNTTAGTLMSAIKQVAYPDQVWQGQNTNTCASTALQGIMANEDPAEFMRIATGLAFDGKVQLAGGATLALDASKIGDATDGNRSALSQAVQTSFDTFAKTFPAESDTDFAGGRAGGGGRYGGGRVGSADRFGGGRAGGGGKYGEGEVADAVEGVADAVAAGVQSIGGRNGGQVDGGGLTQNQVEKLYENVVGRLAVNTSVTEDNRFDTMDGIAASLANGIKVPVGVQGIDDQGNATHHMITVLGIRQDAKDPGNDQVVFTDPGTGKQAALPVRDFTQILEAAIIPAQFADHMRWNVAPDSADPFGGGRAGGGGRKG